MLRRTAMRAAARASPRLVRFSSSSSPSSKICVAPFKIKPAQAREYLYPAGLLASGKASNGFYAAGLRIFGSGLEPIGKELGLGSTVEMTSLAAAYWPVWRWDMMAEGPWAPAHGGEESPAWLTVEEAYIPGNPYAPLSYISFSIPPLEEDLRTYDPYRDLRQLGDTDIIPVDFTVDPFATLEKLKREIKRKQPFSGMRVDPDKWTQSILAAYPVYFPIYIAEYVYTDGDTKRSYQLVMDAHTDNVSKCRVSVPPSPEMRQTGRMPKNFYVNPAPYMPTMTLILGAAPSTPFAKPPPEVAMQEYSKWFSPEPSEDSDYIRESPTLSVSRNAQINWDDPRIQSWSGHERQENGEYIAEAFEVQKNFAAVSNMAHATAEMTSGGADLKDMDLRISQWENGKITTKKGTASEMKQALEESLERSTAELAKHKPQWLKEYDEAKKAENKGEAASTSDSSTSKSSETSEKQE